MKIFLLGIGLGFGALNVQAQGDSIGVKTIEGVRYVVHSVQKGDNLGRISLKYHVETAKIQSANNLAGADIKIGQELLIPKPLVRPTKMHAVEKGQTLFAVARQYNMEVEEVKTLNKLTGNDLSIGQKLKVYTDGGQAVASTTPATKLPEMTPERGPASDEQIQANRPTTPVVEKVVPETKPVVETPPAKTEITSRTGFHKVKEGETLYSIARDYACSVPELKKINKLESENIRPGMELTLPQKGAVAKTETGYAEGNRPTGSTTGTSLIDMIAKVTPDGETRAVKEGEEFPDLEILKASPETRIAPEAKQTKFTEKYSGKPYIKVEEKGTAAKIEDLSTDQTKFYAFHKYLPIGSYIRVDYPGREQSILVEVVNQLPANDPNIIRLSAKCREYLMLKEEKAPVVLRYVMPGK